MPSVPKRPADKRPRIRVGAVAFPAGNTKVRDEAEAHGQRAIQLKFDGEFRIALGEIRSARRSYTVSGNILLALGTDVLRAAILCQTGDCQRAIEISERLVATIAGTIIPRDQKQLAAEIAANARINIAVAQITLGRFRESLEQLHLASDLFYALENKSTTAMIEALHGVAYVGLGSAHRGLSILNSARKQLIECGLSVPAAHFVAPVAEAHLLLRQPEAAIKVLDDARAELHMAGARVEDSRLQLSLSIVLLAAGRVDDARLEAKAAGIAFANFGMELDLALAYHSSGAAEFLLGNFAAAEHDLKIAENLFADCKDDKRRNFASISLAWLMTLTGRSTRAAEIARRLLNVTTLSADIQAGAQLILTRTTSDRGAAREHLARATQIISINPTGLLRLGRDVELSNLQRAEGNLAGAVATTRSGIRNAAEPSTTDGASPFYLGQLILEAVAFKQLIGQLLAIGTASAQTEAWQWSTYMKSKRLNNTFLPTAQAAQAARDSAPDSTLGPDVAPAELIALSHKYDELMAAKVSAHSINVDYEDRAARRALRQHDGERYFNTDQLEPVVLPSIPEGPLLQYHLLGNHIVAFVIRDGQVYVRTVEQRIPEVTELIEAWRLECERESLLAQSDVPALSHSSNYSSTLTDLYRMLIQPVDDLLEGLDGSRLLILGHRSMHGVPFEALTGPDGLPMMSRFQLTFSPGLATQSPPDTAQVTSVSGAPNGASRLLVLAVPDSHTPGIVAEAEAIARVNHDADIHIGPSATVDLLTHRAPDIDVIHIACHGIFRADNPSCSALRLGDRWITATEISQLDLRGTLVVLNACSTSQGTETITSANGISWAFLVAGARGVIAANWSVDDAVAAEFGPRLHAALADGIDSVRALQLVSEDLAISHPHPSAWAAYRHTSSPANALASLGEDSCQ